MYNKKSLFCPIFEDYNKTRDVFLVVLTIIFLQTLYDSKLYLENFNFPRYIILFIIMNFIFNIFCCNFFVSLSKKFINFGLNSISWVFLFKSF